MDTLGGAASGSVSVETEKPLPQLMTVTCVHWKRGRGVGVEIFTESGPLTCENSAMMTVDPLAKKTAGICESPNEFADFRLMRDVGSGLVAVAVGYTLN